MTWCKAVWKKIVGWVVSLVKRKPGKLAYFRLAWEDGTMLRVLTIDQKATISLAGVDRQDNLVTSWEGVPIWTNSNLEVGTLTVAPDGRSAEFVAKTMGITQVTAALGAVRSKEAVDAQVEAGGLFAFVLTVGPNQAQ